jgi:hypothetical protein
MSESDLQIALWASATPQAPLLRPGAAASFLLLDRHSGGVSLQETEILAVWLNGQPIEFTLPMGATQ